MDDAIYSKSGAITGFHDGKIIYDLQGQPVGRLFSSQVYCLGGHYVGELKNGVILDKSFSRGSIPAHNHARSEARGNSGMRNHGSQRIGRNPRQ
jgi:4-fold beta flower protein